MAAKSGTDATQLVKGAAVREGIAQAGRGELTDEEMDARFEQMCIPNHTHDWVVSRRFQTLPTIANLGKFWSILNAWKFTSTPTSKHD